MKHLLSFLVIVSLSSTLNANDAFSKKMIEIYPKVDTDNDGTLSKSEEAAVTQQILNRFPKLDKDGDGALSTAEKENLLRIAANREKKTADPTIPQNPKQMQRQGTSLSVILQNAVEQNQVAGCSFLVMHRGEVVFREAVGYADLKSKRPFTTNELCPIASVSKPFLASVLMVLVEHGKLKLNDPVAKYLPEFKDAKIQGGQTSAQPMTIQHLLSHTGGFWGNKGVSPEKVDLIRNFTRPLSDAVTGIANHDLLYEPGTKFNYSGAGYCVAGRVAEVALEQSLEQIAQETLFRPMGLKRTTYLPSKTILQTIPTRYLKQSGGLQSQPSLCDIEDIQFILPGGSLFTTMDEMASFGQLHLNDGMHKGKRILSEASIAEMRRLQTPKRASRTYGLGWFRDDVDDSGLADLIFHGGALGAHLRVDRNREMVCVFLVHQTGEQVAPLKNKLIERVNERFPITKP